MINKVVGSIASNQMLEGYDYGNYNSVYNLKSRGNLDFIPDLGSIDLINSANLKKLDLILSVSIAGLGIVISSKLLDVIKEFTLSEELRIDIYYLMMNTSNVKKFLRKYFTFFDVLFKLCFFVLMLFYFP